MNLMKFAEENIKDFNPVFDVVIDDGDNYILYENYGFKDEKKVLVMSKEAYKLLKGN